MSITVRKKIGAGSYRVVVLIKEDVLRKTEGYRAADAIERYKKYGNPEEHQELEGVQKKIDARETAFIECGINMAELIGSAVIKIIIDQMVKVDKHPRQKGDHPGYRRMSYDIDTRAYNT